MQRVVGDFKGANVEPEFGATPIGEGVELDQLPIGRREATIDLHGGNVGAGRTLVLALTGDPGIEGRELAAQRFNLADATAFFVITVVEAEEAFFVDQFFDCCRIRKHDFEFDAVVFPHGVEILVGFGVEATRVEAEDFDVFFQFGGHINEHDIFGPTEGDGDVVKLLKRVLQDFLRGLASEFSIELGDVRLGEGAGKLNHSALSRDVRIEFTCAF